MTPLSQSEYTRVTLSYIPDKIINEYNLKDKATTYGSVYIVVPVRIDSQSAPRKTIKHVWLLSEQACPWPVGAQMVNSAVCTGS